MSTKTRVIQVVLVVISPLGFFKTCLGEDAGTGVSGRYRVALLSQKAKLVKQTNKQTNKRWYGRWRWLCESVRIQVIEVAIMTHVHETKIYNNGSSMNGMAAWVTPDGPEHSNSLIRTHTHTAHTHTHTHTRVTRPLNKRLDVITPFTFD